jgi:hypothetical protein
VRLFQQSIAGGAKAVLLQVGSADAGGLRGFQRMQMSLPMRLIQQSIAVAASGFLDGSAGEAARISRPTCKHLVERDL